jgi:hypothetical protein
MNGIFANYYGFRESYFEYFESCNISGENTNIYVSVFMVDQISQESRDMVKLASKTKKKNINGTEHFNLL